MENEILNLLPQLGFAGVFFYLLMEERKARKMLEDRVFGYLEREQEETRELVKDATQPKNPLSQK